MNRRKFVKSAALAAGGQFLLNGISFKALSGQAQLAHTARLSNNGKVLVLLQLHGGNDGLNTLIPISQYSQYYHLRPNLAIPDSGSRAYIPLDRSLPDNQQLGLHPDMAALKDLYDSGRVAILQNVGYEHVNGSHFKSRDIWFGGGGYADDIEGGWIGRYLELEYARNQGLQWPTDFPYEGMPDPLGLEFANEVSLGFHTNETVPAGLSIPNPASFFNLVQELPGYNEEISADPRGIPAEAIRDTLYGQELDWILNIEKDTDKYAERLHQAYQAGGGSSVTYPTTYPLAAPKGSLNNPLSANLQIIARLVAGGCQTRVYLIRLGGFDTHVNQVTNYDNTLGKHAALLYHISTAMKAFQDDLKHRNLEDRVLSLTFSEFGRRAQANNSYGSDHGTVAPMLVFGKQVNAGVLGTNPDLNRAAQHNGNLPDGAEDVLDYRTVFNTILQEWFEVSPDQIPLVLPSLQAEGITSGISVADKQPLFRSSITGFDDFMDQRYWLGNCHPNPVQHLTTFSFFINRMLPVRLAVYTLNGRCCQVIYAGELTAGKYEPQADLGKLPAGTYLYRLQAGTLEFTKRLVKI